MAVAHRPRLWSGSEGRALPDRRRQSSHDLYVPIRRPLRSDRRNGVSEVQLLGRTPRQRSAPASPTGVAVDPGQRATSMCASYFEWRGSTSLNQMANLLTRASRRSPTANRRRRRLDWHRLRRQRRRASASQRHHRDVQFLGQPTSATLDANPSYGVAVDPSDNHVYVDEGNQVSEFDSSGNPVGDPDRLGAPREFDQPRRGLRHARHLQPRLDRRRVCSGPR